jgi:hypothetical protein
MTCSLYDGLYIMDPHVLSDYNFTLFLMGNLPETAKWRAFLGGLRKYIDRYTKNINTIPITSEEFVTTISNEYFFWNKNNSDIQAKVFTTCYKANKGLKSTRPPDPSTSTPAKRAVFTRIIIVNCNVFLPMFTTARAKNFTVITI